jgi:hypothetical protein
MSQPRALQLANWLQHRAMGGITPKDIEASEELRRQHAEIERLNQLLSIEQGKTHQWKVLAESQNAQISMKTPDACREWLKEHQWSSGNYNQEGDWESDCPECGGWKSQGHTKECKITAMLSEEPQTVTGIMSLQHRVRVHLANRYSYSHREFCEKLEEILHENVSMNQLQLPIAASPTVIHQWRKPHCFDWHDGHPDITDGGGPYETRVLFTSPVYVAELLTDDEIEIAYMRLADKQSFRSFRDGVHFAERHHQIKGMEL